MKFFTTNGYKHFNTNTISMAILSHNQNKYYKIRHRTIGKHYKNIIIPPTITVSICYYVYKLAEQSISGLCRFLECQRCNILVITHAGTRALPDIYALALMYCVLFGVMHIDQTKYSCLYINIYIYIYICCIV